MTTQTPTWPLLRNELGMDHCPRFAWGLAAGTALAAWSAGSALPLVALSKACGGDLAVFFASFGELAVFGIVYWMGFSGQLFAFAMHPGISNAVQNTRAFEFMFTRAVDRRKLLRIRACVIWVAMLGPLLLMLLAVSLRPPVSIITETSSSATYRPRTEEYVRSFPGSRPLSTKASDHSAILIPRGGAMLIGWVIWLAALCLVLVQAYCALVANQAQHNPWLTGLLIGGPILVAFSSVPWVHRLHPALAEDAFLFFARNPGPLVAALLATGAAVQWFSERRFNKLEIL